MPCHHQPKPHPIQDPVAIIQNVARSEQHATTTHAHSQRTPLIHRAPLLLDGRKAGATRAGEIAQRRTFVRQPDDGRRRVSRTRTPCATGRARRTRRGCPARHAEALRERPCVASGDARPKATSRLSTRTPGAMVTPARYPPGAPCDAEAAHAHA